MAVLKGLTLEALGVGTPHNHTRLWADDVGITDARVNLNWGAFLKDGEKGYFTSVDNFVGRCCTATTGQRPLRILFLLYSPPNPASNGYAFTRSPAGEHAYPTEKWGKDEFARFAYAAFKRFGPQVSYWRENPLVRKAPVVHWQIWNEPNLKPNSPLSSDGKTVASGKLYAQFAASAGAAIKRADPGARVILAGLANPGSSPTSSEDRLKLYISQMGKAADSLKSNFHYGAMHSYASDVNQMEDILRTYERAMRRNGLGKPFWITEFGWSSGHPPSGWKGKYGTASGASTSRTQQAELCDQATRRIANLASELNIVGACWFAARDDSPDSVNHTSPSSQWIENCGLVDHTPPNPSVQPVKKPAYTVYKNWRG